MASLYQDPTVNGAVVLTYRRVLPRVAGDATLARGVIRRLSGFFPEMLHDKQGSLHRSVPVMRIGGGQRRAFPGKVQCRAGQLQDRPGQGGGCNRQPAARGRRRHSWCEPEACTRGALRRKLGKAPARDSPHKTAAKGPARGIPIYGLQAQRHVEGGPAHLRGGWAEALRGAGMTCGPLPFAPRVHVW